MVAPFMLASFPSQHVESDFPFLGNPYSTPNYIIPL